MRFRVSRRSFMSSLAAALDSVEPRGKSPGLRLFISFTRVQGRHSFESQNNSFALVFRHDACGPPAIRENLAGNPPA